MIGRMLTPQAERAYALLRIVSGIAFGFHGLQKIFGVMFDFQPPVGSQIWFGGMIEMSCGTLIAVGFLTSWAAFLASGTMAVAYIQFHWKLQFGPNFFPAVNQGELALIYSFLFLFMACKGAGAWSVDRRRLSKRRPG